MSIRSRAQFSRIIARFFTTRKMTRNRLTYHRIRCYFLGGGRGCRWSMSQEVAERQGRRDDLSLLLKVEVIQTVAALRRRHDRHRFRRVMMMMMVMVMLLLLLMVHALIVAAIVGGARAGGYQVDATHAYRHRGARSPILAATPSLSAPRPEDRYESRQRSYRVDAARIPGGTSRVRQRLASSSFDASRSRLHGSTVRFARSCHVLESAIPRRDLEITHSRRLRRAVGGSWIPDRPAKERASDRGDAFLFRQVRFQDLSPLRWSRECCRVLHRANGRSIVHVRSIIPQAEIPFRLWKRLGYSIRDDGTEHFSGNRSWRKIIVCAGTGFRGVTSYLRWNSARLAHTMKNHSRSEENRESDWRTLMTGGESRPCASANEEKLTTRATARPSWMARIVCTRR